MPTESQSNKVLGRTPDFDLSVLNKETGEKGKVGAAWRNEDGSISITLNSHVHLKQDKAEILTLFKRTPYLVFGTSTGRASSKTPNPSSKPKRSFTNDDEDKEDDVPF